MKEGTHRFTADAFVSWQMCQTRIDWPFTLHRSGPEDSVKTSIDTVTELGTGVIGIKTGELHFPWDLAVRE